MSQTKTFKPIDKATTARKVYLFTPKQIGCRVERLWSVGLSDGNIYANKYCVISREEVVRKAQKSPSRRRKSPW